MRTPNVARVFIIAPNQLAEDTTLRPRKSMARVISPPQKPRMK
ncbi:hypothetical protein [Thermococcus peptonophilus]